MRAVDALYVILGYPTDGGSTRCGTVGMFIRFEQLQASREARR